MGTTAELSRIRSHGGEQRLAARRRLLQPLEVELPAGHKVWVYDLGEGGMGFSGSERVETGSSAELQFEFPETGSLIDATGTVAWSDDAGRAGIRFTRVEAASTIALRRWLKSGANVMPPVSLEAGNQDAALSAKIACLREVADLQMAISMHQFDRDAALDVIVRRMLELTKASGAAIALRENDEVICRARAGNAPDLGVKLSASSLSGECLRTGAIVYLQDSENDPRVDPEVCRQLNLRSLLIQPIHSGSQTLGIAEVLSPEPHNFEDSDILVVSFLTDLIASITSPAEESREVSFAGISDSAGISENEREVEAEDIGAPTQAAETIAAPAIPAVAAVPRPQEIARPRPMAEPLPARIPVVEPEPLRDYLAAAPTVVEHHSAIAHDLEPSFPAVTIPAPAIEPVAHHYTKPSALPAIQIERLRQLKMPAIAAAVVIFLAIASFVVAPRLRKAASSSKPAAAPAIVAVAPANTVAETTVPNPGTVAAAPVNPAPAAQNKVSHSSKPSSSATSQNSSSSSSDDAEVRVVQRPDTRTANSDAAPDAPAIAQLGARDSALPASIITAGTAAPSFGPLQSQGVTEGKLLKKVMPRYPEMARRAGVAGDVVLSATITVDGKLKNVKVVSGSPLLREEAVAAARQWRYSPYKLGGKPVETETHITISFHH